MKWNTIGLIQKKIPSVEDINGRFQNLREKIPQFEGEIFQSW